MKKEYISPIIRMIPLSPEGIIAGSNDSTPSPFSLDSNDGGDPDAEVLSREQNNSVWDGEW